MPKLYFRYGTMNSSKTANLLMVAHNYMKQGREVFLIKPEADTRVLHGEQPGIQSRAFPNGSIQADLVMPPETGSVELKEAIATRFLPGAHPSCVLVDEAQFLSRHNVDALRAFTECAPVICYGLRTDYCTRLFPGSQRLMEVADSIEEVKTTCARCERKATVTAKLIDRRVVKERVDQPIGDNAAYEVGDAQYSPLGWSCWSRG